MLGTGFLEIEMGRIRIRAKMLDGTDLTVTLPAKGANEPAELFERRVSLAKTRMANYQSGRGLVEAHMKETATRDFGAAAQATRSELWRELDNLAKLGDSLQRLPEVGGNLKNRKDQHILDVIRVQASIAALEDMMRTTHSVQQIDTETGPTLVLNLNEQGQPSVPEEVLQVSEVRETDETEAMSDPRGGESPTAD
jgi:hypothetical protein